MPLYQILIVDDHPQNLKLARYLLQRNGYDVVVAESAEEALVTLQTQQPDLILMDVQLPRMDGLQLTRLLRNHPSCAAIPILALSAYASQEAREEALAAGCDDHLSKPIDIKVFLETVKRFLQQRASRQLVEGK